MMYNLDLLRMPVNVIILCKFAAYEGSGDDSFCLVKGKTKKRTAIIMSPESPASSNSQLNYITLPTFVSVVLTFNRIFLYLNYIHKPDVLELVVGHQ